MVMADMLAWRIGIATFDLMQKAVLEKKFQRPVDGGRSHGLLLHPRHLVDDGIGTEWRRRLCENVQNLAPKCGQL
jgi:hypothetical protein